MAVCEWEAWGVGGNKFTMGARGMVMLIKFQEERQELRTVENRPALAKYLFELSQAISSGVLVNPPYATVVALINTDEPEILWAGSPSIQDLQDVRDALNDKIYAARYKVETQTSTVKRLREERENNKRRQEEYEDAHPWICEHAGCKRRFKSERGAKQHEAKCWRRGSSAVKSTAVRGGVER